MITIQDDKWMERASKEDLIAEIFRQRRMTQELRDRCAEISKVITPTLGLLMSIGEGRT